MRFYTGLGDDGTTDLLGARVTKDDPRVEALGTLDEASATVGLGRALAATSQVRAALVDVQRDLYRIMAELAFTPELLPEKHVFSPERVAWLETQSDEMAAGVDLPPEFILPGESVAGAALDVARTVARRAERQIVVLNRAGHDVSPGIRAYLNRLSSLLFIAARVEDHAAGKVPKRAKSR